MTGEFILMFCVKFRIIICTKSSMKGTTDRLIPSETVLFQRALGSFRLCEQAQVHRSLHVAEVFTLWPHSHVSEPFYLGRHHLDGQQSYLSAMIGSAWAGTKAVSPSHCVLLCPICQKSAAQTMQQLPRAQQSLSAVESLSLSCRNHNSNYKSCFVSR